MIYLVSDRNNSLAFHYGGYYGSAFALLFHANQLFGVAPSHRLLYFLLQAIFLR